MARELWAGGRSTVFGFARVVVTPLRGQCRLEAAAYRAAHLDRHVGGQCPRRRRTRILENDTLAREVVKAEEIVDFTPEDNIAERVARRFGAALGGEIASKWRMQDLHIR